LFIMSGGGGEPGGGGKEEVGRVERGILKADGAAGESLRRRGLGFVG
jgi:hypothetical protein